MDKHFVFNYVKNQLDHFTPDGFIINDLEDYVGESIDFVAKVIDKCNFNTIGKEFNVMNSLQYPIFLYFLSRVIKNKNETYAADKVFYLNKIINSIDLYHDIDLGKIFLLGHSLGSVFCKAEYSDYSIYFQNVLIGVNNGDRPKMGKGLVVFPGSRIIGKTIIGDNVVISAGTTIIDKSVPSNVMVFSSENGKLVLKELNELYYKRYFLEE